MKSLKDIPYLPLYAVASTILFGFVAFLALRDTTGRWELTLSGALGGFAYGVYSLRSRDLRYSATISEFHTAAMQDFSRGKTQSMAEFNVANARALRLSLLLYLVVLIFVWSAASYIGASPGVAFIVTIAAFIGVHVIRIAQLKDPSDISFGVAQYAGTAFGSLVAIGVCAWAFSCTSNKADFSWMTFWVVSFGLVLISCLSVHADFAIAMRLRRSTDK
jgi:hypothetical protein